MATQNTDLKEAKKDAIMTPDMYRSMFLRQLTSQCSQSYDKMMAMGFMYTIQKPLRKIYPNDDDYYAALDRHTEFFNITPHVLPFVAGDRVENVGVRVTPQRPFNEERPSS